MSIPTITPQRLQELRNSGQHVDLVDVRTPVEFREVHVDFARNIPLTELKPATLPREKYTPDFPLYVICRAGGRGQQACEQLQAAGLVHVVNVAGGTLAWEQAGLPVIRGKQFISLERQVRIAAGSLVLIGSLLGAFVHPYWISLPAFVGAGLIFAGLTDTCGMGLLLARMPWNQIDGSQNMKATTTPPDSSVTSCHLR